MEGRRHLYFSAVLAWLNRQHAIPLVCSSAHVPQYITHVKTTEQLRSQVWPSTMWVLRTEVRTGLCAKCLYPLSHLADSNTLSILKVIIKIPNVRCYSFIYTFKEQ